MKSTLLLCLLLSLPVSCSSSGSSEENALDPTSEISKSDESAPVDPDAPIAATENAEADMKAAGESPSDAIDPEAVAREMSASGADSQSPAAAPVETAEVPPEPLPETESAPIAAPSADVAAEKIVYPTSARLNVRRGPGTGFDIANVIKFGETISLSGERKKGWLKTTDGLWVASRYTSEKKPDRIKRPAARKKKAKVVKVEAPAAVEQTPAPAAAEATPAAADAAAATTTP